MDRTRRGRKFCIAVLLVSATASGCVARSGNPFSGQGKAEIRVEVDNRSFNQATVWILSSMGQRRLGMVEGKGVKTFTLSWPHSDDMRLRIRVLGGRAFTTGYRLVVPGDHVEIQIR